MPPSMPPSPSVPCAQPAPCAPAPLPAPSTPPSRQPRCAAANRQRQSAPGLAWVWCWVWFLVWCVCLLGLVWLVSSVWPGFQQLPALDQPTPTCVVLFPAHSANCRCRTQQIPGAAMGNVSSVPDEGAPLYLRDQNRCQFLQREREPPLSCYLCLPSPLRFPPPPPPCDSAERSSPVCAMPQTCNAACSSCQGRRRRAALPLLSLLTPARQYPSLRSSSRAPDGAPQSTLSRMHFPLPEYQQCGPLAIPPPSSLSS